MFKAWISAGIMGAAAILAGCVSSGGYYVDAAGQKYDAASVKCITAPIGYVVPDDIYTQKYGQPWGIRCMAGTIPAVIVDGPDGGSGIPVTPVPPGTPETPLKSVSIFANSTEPGLPVGASVVTTDIKGNTTVITASPTGGASVDGMKASDALKQSQEIMKQTQDAVHAQVEKDLAK